ncbi:hypothetical protein AB0D57_46775 [Streptomyces sp. NPDC048275]|uniref:hypothetical protein n=1 Tax=Streptomyces sp. NPDC048275 TaxID=3155629 RepID=UPI0033D282F1
MIAKLLGKLSFTRHYGAYGGMGCVRRGRLGLTALPAGAPERPPVPSHAADDIGLDRYESQGRSHGPKE